MLVSRRWFLVGTGTFISTAFVREATACVAETGRPLLLPPPHATGTLFVRFGDGGGSGVITLGQAEPFAPLPPPIWAEHLRAQGRLERPSDYKRLIRDGAFTAEDLRQPIHPHSWQSLWAYALGPSAQACQLLQQLDLGPRLKSPGCAGLIRFEECQHPGSSDRWVEAADPLTVSLLQARLRELDLPLAVQLAEG